ncbi:MAG: hypothetical protein PHZ03_00485 [Syntrophomonas sp.]|nr:hypothetical protein [Syntrophomonas sp.]
MTTPVLSEVALILVFNHRYDQNIEKLQRIYEKRFSNIFYLMPFYDGNKEGVIPVYENSFQFQGFFAQGITQLFQEKFSHYIFIADDLILNPILNDSNIIEILHLHNQAAYIKSLTPLTAIDSGWSHLAGVFKVFQDYNGVEFRKQLPPANEALSLMGSHGIQMDLDNFAPKYPLVTGYSDFVVVGHESIKRFCRLCGIFAAMRLHAEVATPTALALSAKKIIRENEVDLMGTELWSKENRLELERKYDRDLNKLMESFDKGSLYIHPVKLTGWKIN